MASMTKVVEIFIAYSRKDSEYLAELRTHLAPLERSHRVKVWYDGKIEPGAAWEEAIKKHLHSSDIILLLVSSDALASDYFYDKELSDALERHHAGAASVVPLIVRPCAWRATPLAGLQAIPQDGRPVTDWPVRDNAYADAVESLWKMIDNADEGRREQMEAERRDIAEAEAARHAAERKRHEEDRHRREAAEAKKRLETERQQREAAERLAEVERHKAKAKKYMNRRDWMFAAKAAQDALEIAPDDAEARELFKQTEQPTDYLPEPPKPLYLKWGSLAASLLLAGFILFKVMGGSDKPSDVDVIGKEYAEAWRIADSTGTLTAWRNFLQTHPDGNKYEEAKNRADKLDKLYSQLLNDADAIAGIDQATACGYLEEALKILPDDPDVLKRIKKLGCGIINIDDLN